jgi:trans-aconitate methyltransferase
MADAAQTARFTDGEGYERFMGQWSRIAGRLFLDWLSVPTKLRWLDVGCGTGAFTEIIQQSSDASEIIARASYTQLESMQSEAAPDMIASLAMS